MATLPTEPLSWPQICERFPDQWVCLAELQDFDPFSIVFSAARVISCGVEYGVALREAPHSYDGTMIAHYFTGAPFREEVRG